MGNKSHLGLEALQSALALEQQLKDKIVEYERGSWAANLSLPEVQVTWRTFLSKLESAIMIDSLDDKALTELIAHLATMDTVHLLDKIGQLSPERQERFVMLLNHIAEFGPGEQQKDNARQVKERILMTYRLKVYPVIFSTDRIERAIHLIKQT